MLRFRGGFQVPGQVPFLEGELKAAMEKGGKSHSHTDETRNKNAAA